MTNLTLSLWIAFFSSCSFAAVMLIKYSLEESKAVKTKLDELKNKTI
jgi:hypothetical protein